MKVGTQALSIVVLAVTLSASALACPLWMGLASHGEMPCSTQDNSSQQCPFSVCQANSLYVASRAGSHAPVLVQVIDSSLAPVHLRSAEPVQPDSGAPPGTSSALFLLTHSLLI